MASLAHTTRRPSHVRTHLSAYLAGVGATSALTAGAVVAFLSLATFIAFNGLPFGGLGNDAGAAYLNSSASGSPTSAATALGAARGAVASDPVPAAYRKGGLLRAGFGESAGVTASGRDASFRGGSTGGGTDPGDPGVTPPGGTPPGDSPPVPGIPSPPIDAPPTPGTPSIPVPDPPGGVNPPPVNVPSLPNRPSVPNRPSLPNAPSLPNRPSLPNLPNLP